MVLPAAVLIQSFTIIEPLVCPCLSPAWPQRAEEHPCVVETDFREGKLCALQEAGAHSGFLENLKLTVEHPR